MMFSPPDYGSPESFTRPELGPWTFDLYSHRKPILDAVVAATPLLGGLLLDVGCGAKPYASVLHCREHIGIDVMSSPHAHDKFDRIFDGEQIPFGDGQFDSALCTEVIEHCREPRLLMREIARVLKPGGQLLLTAPMVIHHHEEPHDYQRLTGHGIRELARQAGMETIWVRSRGGVWTVALSGIYLALSSQRLLRRPLKDILWWSIWPFAALAIWIDGRRRTEPIISLGWQMLARKPSESARSVERLPDRP